MKQLASGWFLLLLVTCCSAADEPSAGSAAARALDFPSLVAQAKDKVFPTVVFIKCVKQTHEEGKKSAEEVAGSGVLISSTGELLTNWHVVDKAEEIRCLLFDGQAMTAQVVGIDKDTDLALVQLDREDSAPTLPYARLGDSSILKEGDFVMAMGAPWGMSRSVSIGIVSCTRRFLPDQSEYSLWLQTDASISPGNSGGPLVNTQGEVIGINTIGVMQGGDIGFAIPSETIGHIISQIRTYNKVNWSWTGLQLQPLKDFDRNIYFDGTEGVIVSETDPDCPARQAGILPHDRILKINNLPATALTEEQLPAIRLQLGLLPKSQPVPIELLRNGQTLTVQLTPREKGKVEGEELDCPRWDFTIKAINQFGNPDLYFYRNQGVFILGVKYPGNASNAGLRNQDILLAIDGQNVTTLEEVKTIHQKLLDNLQNNHRTLLSVLRNGQMRQIVLDFSRDYEKQ